MVAESLALPLAVEARHQRLPKAASRYHISGNDFVGLDLVEALKSPLGEGYLSGRHLPSHFAEGSIGALPGSRALIVISLANKN